MIIPALYCGGGLQKIALQLSEELIVRGHRVIVIDEYNPPLDKIQYLSVLPEFIKISSYECTNENIEVFAKVVRENGIDLILYHGFFPRVNQFLEEWTKHYNAKIVSIFHNTPDAPMPKGVRSLGRGVKSLLKLLCYPIYYEYSKYKVGNFLKVPYRFSQKVVLLSKEYEPLYQELTGVANHKIETIPNFIKSIPQASTNKQKKLLYVGRLEENQKKVSRILRIWKRVSISMPNWELILAGEGKCRSQYEEYVSENRVERVRFIGYVPNPIELYKECSISLMTSDYEGFALVLIEAMSAGCIPVAYDSFKSLKDIIDDGVNGLTVRPFDENEFVNKLLTLMNDEEAIKQMSVNATLKAKSYLGESILPKWEALISNILENEESH